MSVKYYVGIDLGSRFHQVAVVDQHSGLVRPSFRIGRGRGGVELLLPRWACRGAHWWSRSRRPRTTGGSWWAR
jgi:hypothetical protein